jgi:predicted dienelactone hydrolase
MAESAHFRTSAVPAAFPVKRLTPMLAVQRCSTSNVTPSSRRTAMGPFSFDAAIGGKPVDKVKALILLSHGNAGTELGHSVLAQALARNGYLVAALRHPGDNWQDRSLIETSPERYFDERPRQASRVIDAILADPAWMARIEPTARGLSWVRWDTRPAATRCWRWREPDQTCLG